MHYLFAPFKQLLSEDCSYSIIVTSKGSYKPLSHGFKLMLLCIINLKKLEEGDNVRTWLLFIKTQIKLRFAVF